VAFDSVRDQLARPDYVPTDADATAARNAFLKLDAGLMGASGGSPQPAVAAVSAAAPAAVAEPVVAVKRKRPVWIPIVLAVVVLGGVAAALFLRPKSSNSALDEGIRAYTSNDRAMAAMKFEQAARAEPTKAMPHVYLSRMAREVGNYTVANQELQTALRVEPGSLEARREYGSLFLAQGNYDMARTFYVRALEVSPSDKPSQGWLGCALIRLNRVQEGQQWLSRAGPGAWSSCANMTAPAPGVSPP
jgi:tetratricopeptide (TPR) repeat protein